MGIGKGAVVTFCLDCGRRISLGSRPQEGQIVMCSKCGANFEVINLEPLELDWAFSEYEPDWETDEQVWD